MKTLKDTGIRLENNPRRYVNTLTGDIYQGITKTIREIVFPDMYSNVPEHILANAAERGSRIHSDTQAFDILGEIVSDEAEWYADAIIKAGFEVIETEYIVTDYKRFASPIDKVLEKEGKIYLADLKTTYKLDTDYLRWQLTHLRQMFEFVNPLHKVEGLVAIWVDRKKEVCEIHDIEPIPSDWFADYLNALENGTPWVNPFAPVVKTDESDTALALIQKLTAIIADIEDLKELEKSYKESIEKLFTSSGVDKWETDQFIITKTKDYEKTSLDSTKLKKEQPEIFEQYSRTSTVNGSIRSTLK